MNILYELKKNLFTRRTVIVAVAIVLLSTAFLVWNERYLIKDKSSRKDFYNSLDSVSGQAEQLKKEYDDIYGRIMVTDSEGNTEIDSDYANAAAPYGKNNADYLGLLGEASKDAERVTTRNTNIKTVLNNPGDFAVDAYYEENNDSFADSSYLTYFINNAHFGWVAVIICIIILASSCSVERESGMDKVIMLTPKGNFNLYLRKTAIGAVTALAVTVFGALWYLFVQWIMLGIGFKELAAPLFMVNGYEMCASGITVGGLFVHMTLMAALAAVLMACITVLLSRCIGKSVFAGISAFAVYAIGILCDIIYLTNYAKQITAGSSDWYLVSVPTFYKIYNMEKRINPLALLDVKYYFEQPRLSHLFTGYYNAYLIPIMVTVILCFVMFALTVREDRYGK